MGIRLRLGRDLSGRQFWRGRRAVWLLAGGIAVVAAAGSVGAYQLTSGNEHASAAPATAKVQRGTVTSAVAAAGTLQPAQSRGLAFSTNGTVTEVKVRPGDQVTVGEVLARIDDADAKDKVSTAQDALDAAETTLTTAQDAASSSSSPSSSGSTCVAAAAATSSGTVVEAGLLTTTTASASTTATATATASTSPSPSASASASASPSARASASPSASKKPSGGGSPTGGSSRGGSSCASGGSGGTSGGSGGAGNSGGSSTSSSDPVLRAQQAVNNAQLSLQQAQEVLAGTTITAPIAGKVLSVAGAVGSQATSGGTGFIVLGNVAEMQVKASFPEADAIRLKVGLKATITLADRPDEQIAAKVTQVDPVGTTSSQMIVYGALLAFDKVPSDLLNGQSADVRVETGSAVNVLFVPGSAVHGIANGTGTVQAQVGQTVEQRQVQVGLVGDQYTEIKSGLTDGEEVRTLW
jgi:multidrug efflux pump subunit AcrA (membrane-fusion protein)